MITNVSVRGTNDNKPKLIDWLYYWKVEYWTSIMPEDSMITSNDVCLVLQFDSNFRICRDVEIKRLVSLKIWIHQEGGPPTCRLCHCNWCANVRYSRCIVWGFPEFSWALLIFATASRALIAMVLRAVNLDSIGSYLSQIVLLTRLLNLFCPNLRRKHH